MIEVGEYVRTKDGYIAKIINDNTTNNSYFDVDNFKILRPIGPNATMEFFYTDDLYKEEIVKHSKNIIDLLKVGDIVEMYDVLNEDVIYIWNEEMLKAVKEDVANGIKIRRILTKEQYEANCYKVKEE